MSASIQNHAPLRHTARLALGTVQFGKRYGIANPRGPVPVEEVAEILRWARARGMHLLDTASAYGASESILGACGVNDWDIVTKLSACPPDTPCIDDWVRARVERSLKRLGVPTLYGLLLHRPQQLLDRQGTALAAALSAVKGAGLVERVGVSIYAPEELSAYNERMDLDLVQCPFNVLDQRMRTSGWLKRLKQAGVEIHARSIFLQGVLLMPPAQRPPYFQRWESCWLAWSRFLQDSGLSALQACVGSVLACPEIDYALVGVDALAHCQEIIHASDASVPMLPAELTCSDPELVNPGCWPR